ncbi:MAG: GTP-binding protein [Lachnospiraceae bacterium]|nr:GTP-binding protein [Lachnospiraceae bacterium]
MTKIDIISGFLGAGKTTLIKKLIKEVFAGEQIVLIENEFGEIGIDGGFLKDAGINITEMNSGCICCSLVGDFGKALKEVMERFHPSRIIIEPSGVGKLSDVRKAVQGVGEDCDIAVNSLVTVADAMKVKMYSRNFGEFYNNQIESAGTIILSRTQKIGGGKLDKAVELIREKNPDAVIITTPWEEISGEKILGAMEKSVSLADQLLAEEVCPVCGHHHDHEEEHEHHHEHGGECCGHEHEHDGECCGHEHDHEHGGECCEHEHEHEHDGECHEHHHDHEHDDHDHDECGCGHDHHHDHDECGCGHDHHHDHDECGCGHDHHHEHGHHHADEIFTSWGRETPRKYTRTEMEHILKTLSEGDEYGAVLRAKGMLPAADGTWIYFDLVPGEYELREGQPDYTGRLCVIGSKLQEEKLAELFLLA